MNDTKKPKTLTNILLAPFLFIISFIKHFFIGVKFVFYDAIRNIFLYARSAHEFKRIEKQKNSDGSVDCEYKGTKLKCAWKG